MSWTFVLKNMFINSILLKADVKVGNSCFCSPKAVLFQVYYPLRTMMLLLFRANGHYSLCKSCRKHKYFNLSMFIWENIKEITSRNSLRI